ncbi:MAG: Lrp/AsnC family transcriptional regulator [Chloroflexi bacterium]|jgi:Lrp/AsnC family transcriptional regulator for asnA, asnC and gidA|nr:Lrp/AsnC family transcriptional regulator [Anaerolineaceae bacterium]NMB90846.1 Lrp/AsnC family transcriptional regulator [Chloroflexota bacterium]
MIQLDDLDYQILKVLMKDGQVTNVELSKMMGTSVNTIRNRIQRLIDNKVLQIIGVTNPLLLGFDVHVIMNIDVEYAHLASVAEGFAAMGPVRYVAYASGEHNLVVMAFFPNMEHYFTCLTQQIAKLEGIRTIKTMFVGQEIKRNYDYVGHLEELKQIENTKELQHDN